MKREVQTTAYGGNSVNVKMINGDLKKSSKQFLRSKDQSKNYSQTKSAKD